MRHICLDQLLSILPNRCIKVTQPVTGHTYICRIKTGIRQKEVAYNFEAIRTAPWRGAITYV